MRDPEGCRPPPATSFTGLHAMNSNVYRTVLRLCRRIAKMAYAVYDPPAGIGIAEALDGPIKAPPMACLMLLGALISPLLRLL